MKKTLTKLNKHSLLYQFSLKFVKTSQCQNFQFLLMNKRPAYKKIVKII